jgi:hypothetical protein
MVACLLISSVAAGAAAATSLERARNAYLYGDYQLVVNTLRPLLYPTPQLETVEQVVEARRLLGLSYLFLKDEASAELEFVALLTLRPDASLDPLSDPPPFVEFFERIKARIREQLEEIRRKQQSTLHKREAEQEALRRDNVELRKRLQESESTAYLVSSSEKSRLVAVMPFGAGQFQNGDTRKGIAFLVSQLALGTASVSCAIAIRLKWPDGSYLPEERDLADTLVSAQVITGAAFFAAALWGIVDANVHFVSRRDAPPRRVPRDTLPSAHVGVGFGSLVIGGAF